MTEYLIQAQGLHKSFGDNHAVNDVSLHIAAGEIYGLVGSDGAGKTTTLRLLVGALQADEGEIEVGDYDIRTQVEQARSQIGYLSQRFSLYEDLTVLENIRFFAEVRGLSSQEWQPRSMEILEFVELADFKDRLAGQLSGGMKQKLGLASALVTRPRVLLLDEPTTGVDPVTRQDFWQLVIKLVSAPLRLPPFSEKMGVEKKGGEGGVSVLLTTPYMDEAVRCHRVGFMREGKIIAEGTPSELRTTLNGRILELRGDPITLLRKIAHHDEDVEDVQAFGDRLHVRVGEGKAGVVLSRLKSTIRSEGGEVTELRSVPPILEDVFIALSETDSKVLSSSKGSDFGNAQHQEMSDSGRNLMTEPVVITEDLTRLFGDFVAVDHVTFQVNPGEVVGYLGPNGSGKTTTIRMLLGLLKPSDGHATVLGYDAFRQSEEVRARAGYMSQKFALYDDLTVWENIEFYGGVYGITDRERIASTLGLLGLTGHESTLTASLSAGWRQRLALGIALVHEPKLLFLDEPTSGVDPTARRAFWDLIYDLASGGVTVFVTTHYMDEAEYCERVGIMRAGKLLAMDTPDNLKKNIIEGDVWQIAASPLQIALDTLPTLDGVLQVGMAGDQLRAITERGFTGKQLEKKLQEKGIEVSSVENAEPTLEDVFLSLAR